MIDGRNIHFGCWAHRARPGQTHPLNSCVDGSRDSNWTEYFQFENTIALLNLCECILRSLYEGALATVRTRCKLWVYLGTLPVILATTRRHSGQKNN